MKCMCKISAILVGLSVLPSFIAVYHLEVRIICKNLTGVAELFTHQTENTGSQMNRVLFVHW